MKRFKAKVVVPVEVELCPILGEDYQAAANNIVTNKHIREGLIRMLRRSPQDHVVSSVRLEEDGLYSGIRLEPQGTQEEDAMWFYENPSEPGVATHGLVTEAALLSLLMKVRSALNNHCECGGCHFCLLFDEIDDLLFPVIPVKAPCAACNDRGFLLADTFEHGLGIERCDSCKKYKSDGEAAKAAYELALQALES